MHIWEIVFVSILVTGIAGFIGSHVARVLLERGEQIIGIDNFSDYYDVNLKKIDFKVLENFDNFTFHNVDISNIVSVENIYKNMILIKYVI